MKTITEKEMREVNGGKWQCGYCKKKYWLNFSANNCLWGHGWKVDRKKYKVKFVLW